MKTKVVLTFTVELCRELAKDEREALEGALVAQCEAVEILSGKRDGEEVEIGYILGTEKLEVKKVRCELPVLSSGQLGRILQVHSDKTANWAHEGFRRAVLNTDEPYNLSPEAIEEIICAEFLEERN